MFKRKLLDFALIATVTIGLATPSFASAKHINNSVSVSDSNKTISKDVDHHDSSGIYDQKQNETITKIQLINLYKQMKEENTLPEGIDLTTFINNYYVDGYNNIETYEEAYKELFATPRISLFSASGNSYYYDTGKTRPSEAKYSKYSLLTKLKRGDIIYEAKGGGYITGHAAIVEGKFTYKGKPYIRIIEAIPSGVKRGIMDTTRMNEKKVSIYRLSSKYSISSSKMDKVISFAKAQLGEKYFLDFGHNYKSSEKDWYCSELVWAAYFNVGVDLEPSLFSEPGVTPRDLKRSSKTKLVVSY